MEKKVSSVLITLCLLLCLTASATVSASVPALEPYGPFEIPDNEAMALLDAMGVGWNLGNTFDAFQDPYWGNEMRLESYWNGCMTTPEMFETLKNAGFRSVRIPVSWQNQRKLAQPRPGGRRLRLFQGAVRDPEHAP